MKLLHELRPIGIILIIGLIHGIIYVVIVPPWQHYDEPGHFERASMIASGSSLLDESSTDSALRREIAASMMENNFYENLGIWPNLFLTGESIWIGVPQTGSPPLYHVIASIPLRVVNDLDIYSRLYALRSLSLALYLVVIALSFALARELTPEGHSLRVLVPLLVSMTPAFTDLMTAINDDVGATLIFSAFLWIGVRTIIKGVSVLRIFAFLVCGMICILTKTTVWVAVPLAVLLILYAIQQWQPRLRWVLTVLIIGTVSIGLWITLTSRDAAAWYRVVTTDHTKATRIKLTTSPFGNHAFDAAASSDSGQVIAFQSLGPEAVSRARNRHLTLGGWAWADHVTDGFTAELWIDGKATRHRIALGTEPVFWAFQMHVQPDVEQIQVNIRTPAAQNIHTNIYYDGLVLAIGKRSETHPPTFDTLTGQTGNWDERQFVNLLRNPSFESTWITLNPAISNWFKSISSLNPNTPLQMIQEFRAYQGFYIFTLKNLFQSYWARFSWNQIRIDSLWYWLLAIITVTGLLGAAMQGAANWPFANHRHRAAFIWLLVACGLVWISALFRLNLPFWGRPGFIPSARYAFPAIIPSSLFLIAGWRFLLNFRMRPQVGYTILLTIIITVDVVSIQRIMDFFNG